MALLPWVAPHTVCLWLAEHPCLSPSLLTAYHTALCWLFQPLHPAQSVPVTEVTSSTLTSSYSGGDQASLEVSWSWILTGRDGARLPSLGTQGPYFSSCEWLAVQMPAFLASASGVAVLVHCAGLLPGAECLPPLISGDNCVYKVNLCPLPLTPIALVLGISSIRVHLQQLTDVPLACLEPLFLKSFRESLLHLLGL